jgi:transcriptional regulator with XRE-family HTH domain
MSASNFAGRLKELRERAGLTQQALADKAGLSKAGIADLEQARREPSWSTAVALAEALGVDCRAFLQDPAPRPQTERGRPPKLAPEAEDKPPPKRPRRRPRKGE